MDSAILIAAGDCAAPCEDPPLGSARADDPPLIPLFGVPLIAHAAADLIAAGVVRLVVLADPGASRRIARALEGVVPSLAWLSVVEREEEESLPEALEQARTTLGGGPFLLRWADAVRSGPEPHALDLEGKAAIALTGRWLSPHGPGARGGHDGAGARGAFHVGVYAFSGPFPPPPGGDGVGWLEESLAQIERSGGTVERRMVSDWWRHRGQSEPELELNHFFLETLTGEPVEAAVADSSLVGAIRCDPTATIRSSVIRGPVVIGAGVHVEDAFVGPFSSIGAGARIERCEVENSVVRERSVVADLGTRLESSVIGPDATVVRDFRIPRGARLSIGPGAQISL
jgi:glucose-1-phosphate thymidylyltransferase